MKIKIINDELSNFNKDYKVKNINYDMVVVEDDNENVAFSMEDVRLVPENKYDELISRYKDILKIKLNTNISTALYAALVKYIEGEIGNNLESLEVLRDEYKISKRGIWEKKLVVVVNNGIPLDITVVGEKYATKFSITFKDISLQDFIEGCSEDVNHLKKEINEKEKSIERYRHMLKEVLKNSVNSNDNKPRKLVSGS